MPKRKDETPTINFEPQEWKIGEKGWHIINRSNWNKRTGQNHFKASVVACVIIQLKTKGAMVQFDNGVKKFCEYQLLTKDPPSCTG